MSNFDIAIKTVLQHEGGFVNDPRDPGGATNYGVSLRWLRQLGELNAADVLVGDFDNDGDVDADDIRKMQVTDAINLYRKYWWEKYGYEKIQDQALATKTFDLAVNMGATAAHRCLQRAVRAATREVLLEDGILGPRTLSVVNNAPSLVLLAAYRSEAAAYYRLLKKPHYENGWLRRAYA